MVIRRLFPALISAGILFSSAQVRPEQESRFTASQAIGSLVVLGAAAHLLWQGGTWLYNWYYGIPSLQEQLDTLSAKYEYQTSTLTTLRGTLVKKREEIVVWEGIEKSLQDRLTKKYEQYRKLREKYRATRAALERSKFETTGLLSPVSLTSKPVTYLQVTQQRGASCGYHTIFNAVAIERLFTENEEICSEEVQRIAHEFDTHIKMSDIDYRSLDALANEHLTKPYYMLSYDHTRRCVGFTDLEGQSKPEIEADLARFKLETSGLRHVICNTGGHWILISAVKRDGQLHLYLANSMNSPLIRESRAYSFITYLLDKLTDDSA